MIFSHISRAFKFGISCIILLACFNVNGQAQQEEGWIPLFNGKDLNGWNVKIAKHPLNENYNNTFYVEDGILKVGYDAYEKFDMQFGHLFSNLPYSHYILRLDYMFLGKGLADAPSWTNFNSGVMLHAQPPQSMRVEQSFPVCIEAQFLSEGTTAGKQTANAVSPGTHLEFDGKLSTQHITDSKSKLYPLNEWVSFEVEVHGYGTLIHRVNGEEVIKYANPVLDESDRDAKYLLDMGANKKVSQGFIALQAEGQPVWFKNIRIKVLED